MLHSGNSNGFQYYGFRIIINQGFVKNGRILTELEITNIYRTKTSLSGNSSGFQYSGFRIINNQGFFKNVRILTELESTNILKRTWFWYQYHHKTSL